MSSLDAADAGRSPRGGRRPTAEGFSAVGPRFQEVASDSGIEFTYFNDEVPDRYFLPEVMGGGAAWLDYDGDGRLDLYLANGAPLKDSSPIDPEHVNRLYRNRGGGRFERVERAAGADHAGFGQGIAVGDFDADGLPDLYVTNYGPNVLLHNNGDGTYRDVTRTAGVDDPLWGTSAVWLDVDRDGDLDLYVVNYLNVTWENYQVCRFNDQPGYCGPGQYEGQPDRLYLNRGDGTFEEAAERFGIQLPDGKGLAVAALDFDLDLHPEIYVANDMAANFLFTPDRDRPGTERGGSGDAGARDAVSGGVGSGGSGAGAGGGMLAGRGPRRYRDVAAIGGCAVSDNGQNEASMGVACADFDQDGLPDIFLTHFYSQKNTLYRNLGQLLFQDDSRRTRVAATSFQTLGFGTVALDYDRDGDQDLFVANGHVLGPRHEPNAMRPQLLANDGTGRFEDVSQAAGAYFQQLWLGRGAAGGDFDDDGDLDLVVTHLNRPVVLLRNETADGRAFLGLVLFTADRIPPTGGRVTVRCQDRQWSQPIVAGGSYLSSGDTRLLFGLGDSTEPVDVELHWPSGRRQRLERLEVNRYWWVRENAAPMAAPVR